MARACSTYEGEERCIQGFDGGNLRERDYWEDPGVDGSIILRWIFMKLNGGDMYWIDMTQDRDTWRAVVIAVMNVRVP